MLPNFASAVPVFENRISLGTIGTLLIWIVGGFLLMQKRFWQGDRDSQTIIKLTERQEISGQTDAKLATTQALQQSLLEAIQKSVEQNRLEHHERISRLENEVFFKPASDRRRRREEN